MKILLFDITNVLNRLENSNDTINLEMTIGFIGIEAYNKSLRETVRASVIKVENNNAFQIEGENLKI